MSALGQKQTFFMPAQHVRFRGQSGHKLGKGLRQFWRDFSRRGPMCNSCVIVQGKTGNLREFIAHSEVVELA